MYFCMELHEHEVSKSAQLLEKIRETVEKPVEVFLEVKMGKI